MLGQGLGQDGTVVCLGLHPQRHGLQAPQAQPAVKGAQDCTFCILQEQRQLSIAPSAFCMSSIVAAPYATVAAARGVMSATSFVTVTTHV